MTAANILVRVRDDAHARIAWAVASVPGLAPIGMLGHRPPSSWRQLVRRATESTEFDIVVDPDPDDQGIVVVAGGSDRPGITHASLEGLARSLVERLDGTAEAVWTSPGSPKRTGTIFHFPHPVGAVRGKSGNTPTDGRFAGAGAFGASGSIVCVDDRPFMEAICMAAGAAIAGADLTAPTPVWTRADDYIEACERLGLVLAEARTTA